MSKSVCQRNSTPSHDDFLRLANALRVTLRKPEDRDFFDAILEKIIKFNKSGIKEVIQYNNIFFVYFLKLLQRNCASQPVEIYEQWYGPCNTAKETNKVGTWLEEGKSYFYMEKTADGGIVIYTAIATDPKAGWEKGGLIKL